MAGGLSMKVRAKTLTELLELRAEERPDAPTFTFLLDGDCGEKARQTILTAGELATRARAIGAEIAALCAPGDRALLLHPPGPAYHQAFWGCLQSGAIPVPAYPPSPTDLARTLPKLRAIIQSSGAKVVLTTSEIEPFARPALESLPELKDARWLTTDTVSASSAGAWRRPQLGPDSLALLQYTSGSTRLPKGVKVSHANLLHNCSLINDACDSPPNKRGVVWLPPYHDMGLLSGLVMPLYGTQASAVLMSPLDFLKRPLRWLEAITKFRGFISAAPNFAYELCLKAPPEQCAGLDLSSWEVAMSGAEPIRVGTLERFTDAFAPYGFDPRAWFPCYGLAESTLMAAGGHRGRGYTARSFDAQALEKNRAEPKDGETARRIVGCGSAERIRIVDPATALPVAERAVGEIWVTGESVTQGYWNAPEETRAAFVANDEGKWLRTGDLGFVDDGELYVTGRLKDLLIFHGKNHYPQDLEATVEAVHPALRSGGGAAFSFEQGDAEALGIVYELEVSAAAQATEIVAAVRRAVIDAHQVQPAAIALVKPGAVPKTSSGKIQRSACRAAFLDGSFEIVAQLARAVSATAHAAAIAEPDLLAWMVAQVAAASGLPVEQVAVDQPLAHLGLTSVQMVGLAGALEAKLGRPLPPVLVWEHPTLALLARHLSGTAEPARSELNVTSAPEPIAIVGIGCRFPGASGPDAFWTALRDGVDAVAELPVARLELSPQLQRLRAVHPWGGFLDGIEQFDPAFFHLSTREAVAMDPQQRILLELAWEALHDAGMKPDALAGSATGVYVGISTGDYGQLAPREPSALTGNAFSIAANRVSYALDLKGPSVALDTACSSSLVAVHLACESLWRGEVTAALAGGVNLVLAAQVSEGLARGGFLSPDGRCRTFDARANGYVRGEGAGLVVLKRLSTALADEDEIYAVIRGTAVNSDGRSNGLTAPSVKAQQDVLRRAYARAGVDANGVQYVEAHGTGTALGDPIEATALGAVVGAGRSEPVRVGSVKTNLGHLEAAAGIAGLLKTALALSYRTLPKTLHFEQGNPSIPFEQLNLTVQRATEPWTSNGPRRAGVSSFGFGGTNAHAVLEEAPAAAQRTSRERTVPQWSKVKCWPDVTEPVPVTATNAHPLLGAALELAPSLGRVFQSVVDTRALPYLAEHRLGGTALMPAAGFVELALAAAGGGTVERLEIHRPLKLDRPQHLQAVVTGERCELFARDASADWVRCASAVIGAPAPTTEPVALETLRARCSEQVGLASFRSELEKHGLEWGESFCGLTAIWRGQGEVLGRVEAPASLRSDLDRYRAHPALLDACAQIVGALDPKRRAFLPVGARLVRWHRPLGPSAWSWARPGSQGGLDVCIFDDAGRVALELNGLELRYLDEAAATADVYTLEWHAQPLAEAVAPLRAGPWLLLCDRGGVGAALAERLTATGQTCVCVDASFSAAQRDELSRRVLETKPSRIVHLWSLDAEQDPQQASASALFAFQALVRLRQDRGQLWIVTRGAQALGADKVPALHGAALWGLGRSFAWEHPDAWGGLIDLPDTALEPERLARELLHDAGSSRQVALRADRFVPRLSRASAAPAPIALRPDATYLITGGLGALGLHVAQGLVEQGARRLMLMGRTSLPPRAVWNALRPGDRGATAVAAIRALEARGVSVHLASVDVASADELAAHLRHFSDEGWPRIRGVIHLAGLLADRALMNLDADALREVFRAKVDGAWALHRLFEHEPLDFFVMFSSIASVLGSPGQANYAAANAYLDALAHHRRALGLPALSLSWGPWDDLGLAQGSSERLARGGIFPLSAAEGVALTGQLLSAQGHFAVVSADWSTVSQALGAPPLLSGLAAARTSSTGGGALRQTLLALPKAQRAPALTAILVDRISEALGAKEKARADQALDAMGLDSLMGIELRAQLQAELGIDVEMALLLSGPTIAQLAAVLSERVSAKASAAPSVEAEPPRLTPIQPSGSRPPFFCVHPGAVDVSVYAALAKQLGDDQPFYALSPRELEASYSSEGPGTAAGSIEALAGRCNAALREKQPHGPYRLGGWSLGGVLAFEMSRQLEANGEQVELLALFDSPTPLGAPPAPPTGAELVAAFASYLGVREGAGAPPRELEHGVTTIDEGLDRVLAWGKLQGMFPESHGLAQVRPLFSGYQRGLTQAISHLSDYRPGVYGGRIVYFKATRVLPAYDDAFPKAAAGWGRLTSQPLELVEAGGDHYTMFLEPHVRALAESFAPLLTRSDP
jgi:acyl transferase domain-containing protein/acyl-CoA synthetase (AMP-forming)/AMP-acid ligase II/thioesterase domain-containing protein/acyl carrier protein